ncbi:hypothetical protein [Enterococcus gallinarum]|uniref:hypothetical protein n=1 Tax=Enterococcus gallinarum TaxID=1353 RepID=UPI0015C538AB|nr:hypothetical protein [Enterococcus gallinarum]NQE02676.1 hypothetical protein [Enterococcus gallinarum]
MNTEALVLDLLVQQKQMEALQNYLMKTSMVEDEASQTFLFDLKDYVDSLSLVTIYETAPTIEERQVEEMSAILGDQAQTLRELIRQLEELEDAGKKDFYGQQDGELRRTIAGLKGILELNGLLLQDNLTFQRKWKDTDGTVVVKETACEKNGFFQRLFGKNK